MRGALLIQAERTHQIGIIPADAGSTSGRKAPAVTCWDHPRGCGEHVGYLLTGAARQGSSPRTRGARPGPLPRRQPQGIIPADAGSTRGHSLCYPMGEDHPRGCGEHGWGAKHKTIATGSSPRMRGAPCPWTANNPCIRIIPADAGSTFRDRARRWSGWDHPRGCGEHTARDFITAILRGSSPRVRGAHRPVRRPGKRLRIIPADAGSTLAEHHSQCGAWDHPRGCGEHGHGRHQARRRRGSSPRMRGAQAAKSSRNTVIRIIPADAGSTKPRTTRNGPSRDHPRGCGEHFASEAFGRFQSGSSPRMRGAHAD